MHKKVILLFFSCLLFSAVIFCPAAQAKSLETPVILDVIEEPLIVSGTAPQGLEVLVYLDGQYIGLAKSDKQDKDLDEFSLQYSGNLAAGRHSLMAVARDKTSLVLSPPSAEVKFNIGPVPAPTLIAPRDSSYVGGPKPKILGLTVSNSFVRVYIDGVYNGQTKMVSHNSGTANFTYKPFLNLELGWHNLWLVAENKLGEKSKTSAVVNFKVERPMPAATLFRPVVNNKTVASRPFIVGLAKNNSKIKVFVDQKMAGEFTVINHKSGTANFAYKAPAGLTKGQHLVYTTATDIRGKESIISNRVVFTVRQPSIAESAQTNNQGAVATIEEPQPVKSEIAVISPASGLVDKNVITSAPAAPVKAKTAITKPAAKTDQTKSDNELKQIIDEGVVTDQNKFGAVNEEKQFLGKAQLNLAIFILFILAVIAWMLWVNRALIKERQEQNKAAESLDKDKDSKDQQNKLL